MESTLARQSERPVIDLTAIEARLAGLSPDELRARFWECMQGTAAFIAEAALCVKVMKAQGVSLAGISRNAVDRYRKIAAGQLSPELVGRFLSSPNLALVERLPRDDQDRLALDPMVVVIEPKPGGGFDHRKVDLVNADPVLANMAVGPDGLRNVEEQMAHFGAQKTRAALARKPAAEVDPFSGRAVNVPVKFTVGEDARLYRLASEAGISKAAMVRKLVLDSREFKKARD